MNEWEITYSDMCYMYFVWFSLPGGILLDKLESITFGNNSFYSFSSLRTAP